MAAQGIFITGTDTDVGKTYVSCHILKQLTKQVANQQQQQQQQSIGAYKPVCSGAIKNQSGVDIWEDVELLHSALPSDVAKQRICPQTFFAPLAADRAAKLESRFVDEELLMNGWQWWSNQVHYLLVEGAGGVLSPISKNYLVADLAIQIGYPVLIIARASLGTLNQILLTIEASQKRGLNIAGVILNQTDSQTDGSEKFNHEDLAKRTDVPILGTMPYAGEQLQDQHGTTIKLDWATLLQHSVQIKTSK